MVSSSDSSTGSARERAADVKLKLLAMAVDRKVGATSEDQTIAEKSRVNAKNYSSEVQRVDMMFGIVGLRRTGLSRRLA